MIDKTTIQAAIRTHGARKVYSVANSAFANRSVLSRIGLSAANMADVNEVQAEAYRQLGEADQAIDLAQATASLEAVDATKQTRPEWEWVVEDDDGEIIGIYADEDLAREVAHRHTQAGNWDAVVYSRPKK